MRQHKGNKPRKHRKASVQRHFDGTLTSWNDVDWRAMGYRSLAHCIGDIKRKSAEAKAKTHEQHRADYREQQHHDARDRAMYHNIRLTSLQETQR